MVHSDGLTGSTSGMNVPPVRRPMTAVASAVAVNSSKPMARPKVAPKSRPADARTPWALGGGGMPSPRLPTSTHSPGEMAGSPVAAMYWPVTLT